MRFLWKLLWVPGWFTESAKQSHRREAVASYRVELFAGKEEALEKLVSKYFDAEEVAGTISLVRNKRWIAFETFEMAEKFGKDLQKLIQSPVVKPVIMEKRYSSINGELEGYSAGWCKSCDGYTHLDYYDQCENCGDNNCKRFFDMSPKEVKKYVERLQQPKSPFLESRESQAASGDF